MPPIATGEVRVRPVVARSTGSSTTIGGRARSSQAATARAAAALPSMPIFTASISTSSLTASSWAVSSRALTGRTARTSVVFWATIAVIAAIA